MIKRLEHDDNRSWFVVHIGNEEAELFAKAHTEEAALYKTILYCEERSELGINPNRYLDFAVYA